MNKLLMIVGTAELDKDGNTVSVDHDVYTEADGIDNIANPYTWAEIRVNEHNAKMQKYRRLLSVNYIDAADDKLRFGYDVAQLLIRAGYPVTRDTWSREEQGLMSPRIFLVNGSNFKVNRAPLNELYEEGTEIDYFSHIDIEYGEHRVMVWSPTMADLLGTDWKVAKPVQEAFDVEPNDEDVET